MDFGFVIYFLAKGLEISSSVRPRAFRRERWGAFSTDFFIRSLRMGIPSFFITAYGDTVFIALMGLVFKKR